MSVTVSPLPKTVSAGVPIGDDTIDFSPNIIQGMQILNNSTLTLQFFRGTGTTGTAFQTVLPGQTTSFNAQSNQVSVKYVGTPSANGSIDISWSTQPAVSLTSQSQASATGNISFDAALMYTSGSTFSASSLVNGVLRGVPLTPGQFVYITDLSVGGLDLARTLWDLQVSFDNGVTFVDTGIEWRANFDHSYSTPYRVGQPSSSEPNLWFKIVFPEGDRPPAFPVAISGYVGS